MRRSLEPIFNPRSVAVIGASRRRDSIGFALLHNLVLEEFDGTIFPVNPKARSIHSLKAYPAIGDVPDEVDLAVIAVPRDAVLGVAEECVAKGVGGLVVITAGFSETGEEGEALEERLCELVRSSEMRMVGPNCMGVLNTDRGVRLNATFAPTPATAGSIGFVSQSGALGVAILNAAQDLGIGLTQFVSMGNKADVSGNDLVEYWEDDEATRVICMYLESFGNPRKFTEIAKRVGKKKPILIVKSGRTTEGARAATSHTGAIAGGADVTVSAFLEQCGVIRANTIAELFDISQALDRCPLPGGDRVAIVTNAGGPGIMATDACVNLGLSMAELSGQTAEGLDRFLPAEASLDNPVDMIASATPEDYARAIDLVLADEGVDMVIVINVTPLLSNPIDIMDAVAAAAARHAKPVLAVMMATEDFFDEMKRRAGHPPVYRFPESAARAMFHLSRYARWRQRPTESAPPSFDVDDVAVAELLAATEEGHLPDAAAFEILDLYGIRAVETRGVGSIDEAVMAADEIGGPVALKAFGPDLVHKSDAGAVALSLSGATDIGRAAATIRENLAEAGLDQEGWLVQEMAGDGHEVIFGISTDPRFGPILMFGLGGRYVEVFRDVRFGVTPLSATEAAEMIRGIRGFALLEGVRGDDPVDLGVLEETLLRIGQMVSRHPRIRELDINPFIATPDREASKAVDVRIRLDRRAD